MKREYVRAAAFDNRKHTLTLHYASGKNVTVHYGQLGVSKKVEAVWVDKETRGRSVGIRFVDGTEDYMPYDQPLALAKDPDYLLRAQIERLVALIRLALARKRISKRYLAESLRTSDNQIQRLLDPSLLNKNLEQLYQIGVLLGLELELSIKQAA